MYRHEPKEPLILARYLARRYILRNGSFMWIGEPDNEPKFVALLVRGYTLEGYVGTLVTYCVYEVDQLDTIH